MDQTDKCKYELIYVLAMNMIFNKPKNKKKIKFDDNINTSNDQRKMFNPTEGTDGPDDIYDVSIGKLYLMLSVRLSKLAWR